MKVITVLSGKGGTGKTFFSCEFAKALGQEGENVLLFDADLGLSNVELTFGLDLPTTLSHVVRDGRELRDALFAFSDKVSLISGGSGCESLVGIDDGRVGGLLDEVLGLGCDHDRIIFDVGPGIGSIVKRVCERSDAFILVLSPEPTGLTDAYAMAKYLTAIKPDATIHFLVNKADNAAHGARVGKNFRTVVGQFLNLEAHYLGAVRHDGLVIRALHEGRLPTDVSERSKVAQDLAEVVWEFLNPGSLEEDDEEPTSWLDRLKNRFSGDEGEEEVDEEEDVQDAA